MRKSDLRSESESCVGPDGEVCPLGCKVSIGDYRLGQSTIFLKFTKNSKVLTQKNQNFILICKTDFCGLLYLTFTL